MYVHLRIKLLRICALVYMHNVKFTSDVLDYPLHTTFALAKRRKMSKKEFYFKKLYLLFIWFDFIQKLEIHLFKENCAKNIKIKHSKKVQIQRFWSQKFSYVPKLNFYS